MKTCTNKDCGKEYPATTEFFYSDSRAKDGLNAQCIPCKRKYGLTSSRATRTGIKRKDGDIWSVSFTCRHPSCTRPTRVVNINKADYKKMSDKFYCSDHNAMIADDETDFHATTYSVADTSPSEIPYFDSVGGDLRFGGTFN